MLSSCTITIMIFLDILMVELVSVESRDLIIIQY